MEADEELTQTPITRLPPPEILDVRAQANLRRVTMCA
jgi:hypothetical protein